MIKMNKTMTIEVKNGTMIKVRFIERGDKHGRNNCLTYDKPEPIISFYDVTHDPEGKYMISSYYVDTIREHPYTEGLCLDGSHSQYDLSRYDMALVKAWLFSEIRA